MNNIFTETSTLITPKQPPVGLLVPKKCVEDAMTRETQALAWGKKMTMWLLLSAILNAGLLLHIAVLKGWVGQ